MLKAGFIFFMGIATSFYWGWAFMTLWGWFAVAAAGLPSVPYVTWVGGSFFVGQLTTFTYSLSNKRDVEKNTTLEHFFFSLFKIIASLVGLGMAYVAFLLLL